MGSLIEKMSLCNANYGNSTEEFNPSTASINFLYEDHKKNAILQANDVEPGIL